MYTTEFIKLQNSLVCVYIILAVSRSYACYGSPNYNNYLFRWAYALAHGTSKPHNFIRVPFDKSEMEKYLFNFNTFGTGAQGIGRRGGGEDEGRAGCPAR